jgi:hypothetical protein
MIKIDFEKTDGLRVLRDAIYLKEDHNLTEEEIEAIKQQRFDTWIAILDNPVVDQEVLTEEV